MKNRYQILEESVIKTRKELEVEIGAPDGTPIPVRGVKDRPKDL